MSKRVPTDDLLEGMLQVTKALGVRDTTVAENLLAPAIKGLIDERDQFIALSGESPDNFDDDWHISVSSNKDKKVALRRTLMPAGPNRIPIDWGTCKWVCIPFTDFCWEVCYSTRNKVAQ